MSSVPSASTPRPPSVLPPRRQVRRVAAAAQVPLLTLTATPPRPSVREVGTTMTVKAQLPQRLATVQLLRPATAQSLCLWAAGHLQVPWQAVVVQVQEARTVVDVAADVPLLDDATYLVTRMFGPPPAVPPTPSPPSRSRPRPPALPPRILRPTPTECAAAPPPTAVPPSPAVDASPGRRRRPTPDDIMSDDADEADDADAAPNPVDDADDTSSASDVTVNAIVKCFVRGGNPARKAHAQALADAVALRDLVINHDAFAREVPVLPVVADIVAIFGVCVRSVGNRPSYYVAYAARRATGELELAKMCPQGLRPTVRHAILECLEAKRPALVGRRPRSLPQKELTSRLRTALTEAHSHRPRSYPAVVQQPRHLRAHPRRQAPWRMLRGLPR